MIFRSKKIEKSVFEFYKTLPKNLVQFPFNVKKTILTLKNCTIHSYQEFAEHHRIRVKEVIEYCESDIGCVHMQGNNYIIMYNDSPYIIEERKTFTLAHELGHVVLGHDTPSHKLSEDEANYFAACLLCPLPILTRIKPYTFFSIHKIFELSFQASQIAFDDLKIYDKNYYVQWHNDIINLFDFQCDLLEILAFRCDYIYRISEIKNNKYKLIPSTKVKNSDDFPDGIKISKFPPSPYF